MQLALSYGAPSGVDVSGGRARLRLSGAEQRPRLRYRGVVKEPLTLREVMGALHDVVIADFRWQPPQQREEFRRWLAYRLDQEAKSEAARLAEERRRYFEWLWHNDREAWWILDPVCSVHPDQVFFEAFSKDGSSYGRVGLDRSALDEQGEEVICGTTNVDFSQGLYEAVRRMRSIFTTEIALGETELELATTSAGGTKRHEEKQVELPESWIRGFLQIGAAFQLPALEVELLPVHVYDLCRQLRLHRARVSPRALRWELTPGQPVEVVFEPWETRYVFRGSSHSASERRIVRIWGRRRLTLIERLIPVADRFTIHLLGRGLPYFVTARSGLVDFTLGLSGWTKNDWTSTARFDALIARQGARGSLSEKPLAWLQERYRGTPAEIAEATGTELADVQASLVEASGRGLVVYDLLHKVYRYRPLLADPLPPGLGPGQDPHLQQARDFVRQVQATVTGRRRELSGATRITGRVEEDPTHVYEPVVVVGDEGAVKHAECTCYFAKQHGLKQGLCPHAYALLLVDES